MEQLAENQSTHPDNGRIEKPGTANSGTEKPDTAKAGEGITSPKKLDLSRMSPPDNLEEARLEEITIDGICGVY